MKFDHKQVCISDEFASFAFRLLDGFFAPMTGDQLSLGEAVDIAMSVEHRDKACGYPWNLLGCTTKQQALDRFGAEAIYNYYCNETSVLSATLKDEMRPIGKDARLFRPQDLSSYLEGIMLFQKQNEYLMAQLMTSPIFVRFRTPGPDIIELRNILRQGDYPVVSVDGQSWDTNFPLAFASLIATWRVRHGLPLERVQRYYSMIYNGYTSVYGLLLTLCGQASGHVNTTIDNCLAHILAFAYHLWRNGYPVETLMTHVRMFCCGDDAIYKQTSALFEPQLLSQTYAELGMFLEFEGFDSVDKTFVGTRYATREYAGVRINGYAARRDKFIAAARCCKRSSTVLDRVAKLTSLCQLSFFDQKLFEELKAITFATVGAAVASGAVTPGDRVLHSLLRTCDETDLYRRYFGLESSFLDSSC